MKKIITTILLLMLAGCSFNNNNKELGAELTLAEKIEDEVDSIEAVQSGELASTSKYKKVDSYTKDGITYSVPVEYKTPSGEVGYVIEIIKATSTVYIGYGSEAESRSYTIETEERTPTTTSRELLIENTK